MADESQVLKYKLEIAAPLQEVYYAFTTAAGLREWLCSVAHIDALKGGRVYLWWESGYYANGEVIELIPYDRIIVNWHGKSEPGASRLKVNFKSRPDGAQVTLIHQNLGNGPAWKKARKEIKRGWQLGLNNLKSVMESGVDLRITQRPTLGFTSLEPLNPAEARQRGFDERAGLYVLGIGEGMCAQQIGLQAGDLLVKVGGVKVSTLRELNAIINHYRAGDKIKLVYYRNHEKFSVKGSLSHRPMPEIPADPEALALALSKRIDQFNTQLDELLAGVSEAQIDLRSSEEAWSIRETLAHMITAERDMHSWITRMIEGSEVDFSLYSYQPVRVRAIISAFPNTASLRTELRRNQAETAAMVADLPAEFRTRRWSYWRLAVELLQTPKYHHQEYLELIKLALEKGLAAEKS